MGTKLGKINSESKQTVKITAEEYSLIKAIWTRVEFEPKTHGTGFYLRYFAKYPQYIKYYLSDPGKDDVNPDALMIVKFTVIIEVLGYLILDFHNKPKQFNQLMGYMGMMHKDMQINLQDTNNFCTALIEYLKDAMSDLMTDTCEAVVVDFFRNIQELMIESMAKERQRFNQEENDALVTRSHFKALLPCTCPDLSNGLIYGQPREYWVLRELDWSSKISSWEQDMQVVPFSTGAVNVQNTLESTSSDEDAFEKYKTREKSEPEIRNSSYNEDEKRNSFLRHRAKYSTAAGRLASIPHFEQRPSEFSDVSEIHDHNESFMIDTTTERSTGNVRLTPRERHRAEAAAVKALRVRPSGRLISSTDTSSPRYSDESAARERRRRSTWN